MHSKMQIENVTLEFTNIQESSTNKARAKSRENELCPLCNSLIRLFFINFNQKILMCENTECEFPFGYENLQFVKEDENLDSDDENAGLTSNNNSSSSSVMSEVAWAEMERMNESNFDIRLVESNKTFSKKEKKLKVSEDKIQKNIEEIKDLNVQLMIDSTPLELPCHIKNEKWIKNLRTLQDHSGVQLLKPEEIGLLKKQEPNIGPGELKINIDPGNSESFSSIHIEIHNKELTPPDSSKEPDQPTGTDPLPV